MKQVNVVSSSGPGRDRAHVVHGGATRWESRPEPAEAGAPVAYAGICGSDLNALTRQVSAETLRDGRVLGHEVVLALTVQGTGYGAVDPLLPCGRCFHCRRGRTNLCPDLRRVGDDLAGGFATHLAVPPSQVAALPAGVAPETAVLADPLAVAVHALHDVDETDGPALVVGTGTVALLTARLLQHRGLDVTLASRSRLRREWVRANLGLESVDQAAHLGGRPGLVVEARGGSSPDGLDEYLPWVRAGGRVRVVGAFSARASLTLPVRRWVTTEVEVRGVYSHCRRDHGDFTRGLELLADAGFAAGLEAVITHRFPLERLADAVQVCDRPDGFVGKVVLVGSGGVGS